MLTKEWNLEAIVPTPTVANASHVRSLQRHGTSHGIRPLLVGVRPHPAERADLITNAHSEWGALRLQPSTVEEGLEIDTLSSFLVYLLMSIV